MDTIHLFEFDNFDAAKQAASEDAANSFSLPLQAVMYEQAKRICFSTALPMAKLNSLIRFDSAVKGSTNPEANTNRPVMADHVRSIVDYLTDRETYIIPSLTLNVREKLRVYTFKTPSPVRGAMVILPASAMLFVTDGQHRVKAIEAAISSKPELLNDAVSVTLIVEPDIEQVHQDFADCAQTKSIPPSLLALYDKNDELSSLAVDLSRNVEFFHARVEKIAKTVSKRSNNLYTLSQLRMAVGALLTGDAAAGARQLSQEVSSLMGSSEEKYKKYLDEIVWFFSSLVDLLPQWRAIRDSNIGKNVISDVPSFRGKYIHFSGTGLNVICAVGYRIMQMPEAQRKEAVTKLATQVNWERFNQSGEGNPFWVGNILMQDGSVVNSRATLNQAVDVVLARIGLSRSVASGK